MNNFIQKIKLFYSQNYTEVYEEGELIDAKWLSHPLGAANP